MPKKRRFWVDFGLRWRVSGQNGWGFSAGCTKFLPLANVSEFVTIYGIKWKLLQKNAPFSSCFSVFSPQNRWKSRFFAAVRGKERTADLQRRGLSDLRWKSGVLCSKQPKTSPSGLVDRAKLREYNGRSAKFAPIPAMRSTQFMYALQIVDPSRRHPAGCRRVATV